MINHDNDKLKYKDDVYISTEQVDDNLKTDFWRAVTQPLFEAISPTENKLYPLEGTARTRQVAGLLIGSSTFNAQQYDRNSQIILCGGLDHYLVQVITAGTMTGNFSGTSVSVAPGDICIFDLAQTLQSQATAGARLTVIIPRPILAKAMGYVNLHGLVLKAHRPMTRLLVTYVQAMRDLDNQLSDEEAASVQEALVTLLAAALRDVQPDGTGFLQPLSIVLHQRVMDFIDENINNPELGLELILQHFHVSRAHLYRAFAEGGGIARVIRDRRLDAAFISLARDTAKARSITEIAYAMGFSSVNNFLRCFRARFGMTPSEVRRERFSLHSQKISDIQSYFSTLSRRGHGF